MTDYEIVSLIISALGLISLILVIIQIAVSIRQSKKQHEELRRVKTVEVLYNWNNGLKKETRLAEKIVEKFDKNQCLNLYEYMPFVVTEDIHKMLCQMCSQNDGKTNCDKCQPDSHGMYLVEGFRLNELRGNVTNYLNNLEIMALAWQQAIVDRDAIEEQFSFLHNPGKKSALDNYRKIAGGGKSYPMTSEFYEQIKENFKKRVTRKEEQ